MDVRCLADLLGGADAPADRPSRPLTFAGWSFAPIARGVSLLPPGGRAEGEVTVTERHPLVAPNAALPAAAGVEPFTTIDGEYGALARHETGATAFVVGDDWCTRIDGVARAPRARDLIEQAVRALARHTSLPLGGRRRRWYLYAPPASFAGASRRGQLTEWHTAGGRIVVHPAEPDLARAPLLHRLMGVPELSRGQPDRFRPIALGERHGLERMLFVGHDADPVADVAVLRDGRFRYVLQLEAAASNHAPLRAAFGELVNSVRPLPRAPARLPDALAHWAT